MKMVVLVLDITENGRSARFSNDAFRQGKLREVFVLKKGESPEKKGQIRLRRLGVKMSEFMWSDAGEKHRGVYVIAVSKPAAA